MSDWPESEGAAGGPPIRPPSAVVYIEPADAFSLRRLLIAGIGNNYSAIEPVPSVGIVN
jgi:hypothetical protein